MASLELCTMSVLNDNQLDLIKQYLLSRNVSEQLEAVKWLTNIMKSVNMPGGTHIPDILINADIAEYLSEAMATQHNDLLYAILLCLEQLLTTKNFFFERRALYTVDCLSRAINFLLKQSCNTKVLTQALKVLSILLEESGGNQCGSSGMLLSTTCNVDQIIDILKSVLQNRMNTESETVLAACGVFYSCLFHFNSSFTDKFIQGLDICLESLAKLVLTHGTSSISNKSIKLLSRIGLTLLRSHRSSNQLAQNKEECMTLMAEQHIVTAQLYDFNYIVKKIFEYLSLSCFPYIMNTGVYTQSYDACRSVLRCVHLLYSQAEINIKDVSEKLVLEGFLVHLPIIMNIAHIRKNTGLMKVCVLVLTDLLTNLSSLILHIDKSWSGGIECFRKLIEEGLLSLKTGLSDWFQYLKHTHSMSVTETIIVYFYFMSLFTKTEDCPLDALSISMCINQYPYYTKYPIPLRKAVLFVFAVSVLTSELDESKIIINKATGIMIKMIESCGLDKIYTHHPALLYWAFTCAQTSYSIKREMVEFWLLKEANDTGDILMHLAILTPEASFCIMDVVQNGYEILARRGIHVLKKAVLYEQSQNEDKIICLIWNMLPRLLAKLNSKTNPLFVNIVSRTLNLATLTVPFNPNITDMIAAATFLTNMLPRLARHSLNLSIAAVKYCLSLLLTSVEMGDYRVLSMFIKEHKFVQVLQAAIQSSELDICTSSLKLLCFMFVFQIKLQSKHQLRCERSLEIDGNLLLKLLNHDDINILTTSLRTTQLLMNPNIEKPLLKVVSNRNTNKFLLSLFSSVQDICFKKLVGTVDSCWKCLGAIIEYAAFQHNDSELLELLATQPWTHVLIKVTLNYGCSQLTNEFLNFVNSWLMYYQKPRTSNSVREVRKIKLPCKSLMTVSVMKLAKTMLQHFENLGSNNKNITALTLQRILNSDAELPKPLETALIKKVTEMDVDL